jgi:branched-chain amino acid transport system permease protein
MLPEFWRRFLTEILIWGLLAMSSDILIGYAGMVSFGHSALFGLGIYGAAAALLAVQPPNLWLAMLCGLASSAAVAVFVAYFSTRLRDIYFAITTLIFSQIFYVIIFTWTNFTGGENGLTFSRPRLGIPGVFSVPFTSVTLHWFVLTVVTASICYCGGSRDRRSGWYFSPFARTRHGPERLAIRSSGTRSWR